MKTGTLFGLMRLNMIEQIYVTDIEVEGKQLKITYSDATTKLLDFPELVFTTNNLDLALLDEAPTPKEVIDTINAIINAKPLTGVRVE